MPAADHASPLPHPRLIAGLLASLTALGPFAVDAYFPSMASIGRELHASELDVQATLTAFMIPFAAMTLWHGAISDTLGRRRVILWGVALFGAASVIATVAHDIRLLLLCRVLQGLVAGAGAVVGRAIVRDLYAGADAQRVMSHATLAFAMAPAVAPVIGGWLETGFGWRSVFLFLVIYAAVLWALVKRVLPETLRPERRQPLHAGALLGAYGNILRDGAFMGLAAAATLNFAGLFIYIAATPVFLTRHLGVPSTGYLWLFGPVTAGMALGAWLSAKTAGRVSAARTLTVAYSLMGAAAVGNVVLHLLRAPGLPWSVAPMFFYNCGMSLGFPTLTLLALDRFPERRGLASSCQAFVQTAGAALVSVAVPLVWDSVRSLALTQLCLLSLGLGTLWLSWVRRTRREALTPAHVTAPPF